jgi:hypothetical protein
MSRSRSQTKDGEAGYFLTDAVVGLFVLASVAGSLMGAFGLARSFAERAEHSAKALVVAKACIEENSFAEGEWTFDLDGVDYVRLRSFEDVERDKKSKVRLVQILCAVRWRERGGPREVQLERIDFRSQTS